MNEWTDRDG